MSWFTQTGFMPHLHCYLGNTALIWTMFGTDLLIGLAYLAISLTLWELVRRIKIPFSMVVLCFGIFIAACGLTHFMEIWTLWYPDYWVSASVKVVTAIASVGTGFYLFRLRGPILELAESARISESRRIDLETLTRELETRVLDRTSALERSEKMFISTFAQAALGLSHVSLDGRWIRVNEKYTEMLGYTEKELQGMKFPDITHPEDLDQDTQAMYDLIEGKIQTYTADKRYLRKDGSVTWVSLTVSLVRTKSGEPDYFIAAANDINDRKRFELELTLAKEEAERANRLKSAFLANMSHEIRTPLGAMLGFAELLKDPELTPSDHQNHLEVITRNGQQLSVIINDILDLSKVEAGQLIIEKIPCHPEQVAIEVVSLFQLKAREKGLILDYRSPGMDVGTIISDPTRIKQILMNLVGNAVKFTNMGEIILTLENRLQNDGQSILCFQVRDTGIGIAPEQRERIFELFVQGDGSMTRRFGGTGLGLSLSRRLAHELGGDVRLVDSHLGKGSVFEFCLAHRKDASTSF